MRKKAVAKGASGATASAPRDSFREAFPTAPGGGDAVAAVQSQVEAQQFKREVLGTRGELEAADAA